MHLLSGLIMGLLGSLHCIGMCGPIALSLPMRDESKVSFFTSRLLYNLGRVLTYMILGIIFGYLGQGLRIISSQQIIAIVFGVILLLFFITPAKYKQLMSNFPPIAKIKNIYTNFFGRVLRYSGNTGMFVIGVVNGFIPCGFVYLAIAAAVAFGSVTEAVIFMGFFGLGTIPSLFVVSSLPQLLKNKFNYRKLVPVFSVILAILFILRGMDLGIPFISPKLEKVTKPQMHIQPEQKPEENKGNTPASEEKEDCCS